MDIMLDLETMGNGSRAAIIAIGAVAFDHTGVKDHFYAQVNLQSSMAVGMECDASTVMWWMQQSEQARAAFKDNEKAGSLQHELAAFSDFCRKHNVASMWGNGAAFDNAILSSAYRLCGLEQPWKFWNDRCYRTIKAFYPGVQLVRKGTHHNALDDAASQADHLVRMLWPAA